jgi:hypothetical protein
MSFPEDLLGDIASMRRYAMPGQCLSAGTLGGDRGTIGIIGVDRRSGRKVAVTAMHVVPGVVEYPSALHPHRIDFESPCAGSGKTVIGRVLRGTMSGIDAALIDIEGQTVTNTVNGIGTIRAWRPIVSTDRDRTVRMVGASSISVQYGRIIAPSVPVSDWNLDSAIVVEIAALPGDSGAPLVDENGHLLGILVGGNPTRQFFCPIDLIFHRLSCQFFRG